MCGRGQRSENAFYEGIMVAAICCGFIVGTLTGKSLLDFTRKLNYYFFIISS